MVSLKFFFWRKISLQTRSSGKMEKIYCYSMVFSVQGPTCCSVTGGLFNISEWPEGILTLTVTHCYCYRGYPLGKGGGGISTEKGKGERGGNVLVQQSADRGESLRWNVASSANGMVWHTFSPIKQKRGASKCWFFLPEYGEEGVRCLLYICLWLCHIIGMGTRTGHQLLPGRGAAVVGFYSKHILLQPETERKPRTKCLMLNGMV